MLVIHIMYRIHIHIPHLKIDKHRHKLCSIPTLLRFFPSHKSFLVLQLTFDFTFFFYIYSAMTTNTNLKKKSQTFRRFIIFYRRFFLKSFYLCSLFFHIVFFWVRYIYSILIMLFCTHAENHDIFSMWQFKKKKTKNENFYRTQRKISIDKRLLWTKKKPKQMCNACGDSKKKYLTRMSIVYMGFCLKKDKTIKKKLLRNGTSTNLSRNCNRLQDFTGRVFYWLHYYIFFFYIFTYFKILRIYFFLLKVNR